MHIDAGKIELQVTEKWDCFYGRRCGI